MPASTAQSTGEVVVLCVPDTVAAKRLRPMSLLLLLLQTASLVLVGPVREE